MPWPGFKPQHRVWLASALTTALPSTLLTKRSAIKTESIQFDFIYWLTLRKSRVPADTAATWDPIQSKQFASWELDAINTEIRNVHHWVEATMLVDAGLPEQCCPFGTHFSQRGVVVESRIRSWDRIPFWPHPDAWWKMNIVLGCKHRHLCLRLSLDFSFAA